MDAGWAITGPARYSVFLGVFGGQKSLSGRSWAGQRGSSDQGQQCVLLRPQKLPKPPAARPTPWTAQPGTEELVGGLGRTGKNGRAGKDRRAGCCQSSFSDGANKGKWGLWEGRRSDPDPDPDCAQPEGPWAAASLSPPARSCPEASGQWVSGWVTRRGFLCTGCPQSGCWG